MTEHRRSVYTVLVLVRSPRVLRQQHAHRLQRIKEGQCCRLFTFGRILQVYKQRTPLIRHVIVSTWSWLLSVAPCPSQRVRCDEVLPVKTRASTSTRSAVRNAKTSVGLLVGRSLLFISSFAAISSFLFVLAGSTFWAAKIWHRRGLSRAENNPMCQVCSYFWDTCFKSS